MASSSCTRATAFRSFGWLAGAFSQRLTPDGCGSGTATESPTSKRRPMALVEALQVEQAPGGQPAHDDDQSWTQQLELPLAPERAELLLPGGRRPVAAAGPRAPRVAPRDRGAVEGVVELVLIHAEPAAKRLARTPPPRPALDSLDHPGRLAEHVRTLAGVPGDDRKRLDRISGLGTGPAAAVVALQGSD